MLDGAKLLDENATEQLYRVTNDLMDTVILICNGEEYCLGDWQTDDEPETLEEAAGYDWLKLSEIAEWHS